MTETFKSDLAGFYKLTMDERRKRIAALTGLDPSDIIELGEKGLSVEQADQMVENAVGVLGMPLGVCVNLRVDGRDWLLPMAVEEPSVIAACSNAAKMLRSGEGVKSHVTAPLMIGQIQILDVPDHAAARRAIFAEKQSLLEQANSGHPALIAAGGGALDIELYDLPRIEDEDPCGDMLVLHLVVDVRDAMGANAINSMCERLASRIALLSGGRVVLRILSNLNDRRLVTVEGEEGRARVREGDRRSQRVRRARSVSRHDAQQGDHERRRCRAARLRSGLPRGRSRRARVCGARRSIHRDGALACRG